MLGHSVTPSQLQWSSLDWLKKEEVEVLLALMGVIGYPIRYT